MKSFPHIWKQIKRVIRSYSAVEKSISLLCLFVIVWFLGGVMFSGNGGGDAGPQTGGRYSEGLVGYVSRLNPVYVDLNNVDRTISSVLFEGLMKYDPQKGTMVENLAAVTISEDKKSYQFKLREGVKWHDGEVLTADDVMFTFKDIIQNPEFDNLLLKANFDGVEVKKVDEMTVEFVLDAPNSFFITNTTVGILPEHMLREVPIVDLGFHDFNVKPVGLGPYKVVGPYQIFPDGRMEVRVERYDEYFAEKSKIQELRFVAYPSLEELEKEKNALNGVAKLSGETKAVFAQDERFGFMEYQLPQYTALFLNMNSPVLQKRKVRIALQKALDKQKLLEMLGDKKAVDTPLLELNQKEWLYQANVKEAQGGLYDSRYRFAEEGDQYRKDSKGNVLEVTLLLQGFSEDNPKYRELQLVLAFLKQSWEAIGVKVNDKILEGDEFIDAVQNRSYDIVLTGQSLGYNLDTYSFWHSTQARQDGLNLSNYKSFSADSAIEAIRESFDQEEKKELLNDLAKVIAQDVPAIFLYRPVYFYVTDGKLKNVQVDNLAFPSDRYANVAQWYVYGQ